MAKNYYEILGVSKDASEDEIKKAFKKGAVKWHPDRWGNKSEAEQKTAEEKFKELNEAYDVLSDPEKKAHYDRFGSMDHFGQGGMSGGVDIDLGGIFKHMMGGFRGIFGDDEPDIQESNHGRTIEMRVGLSIEDVYNGCEKTYTVNRGIRCKSCNGTGGEVEPCPHCQGQGKIIQTGRNPWGGMSQSITICPHCQGTGKILKKVCNHCGGSGFENIAEEIKVTFRKGIRQNERITIPYKGWESPEVGGTTGDLVIIPVYDFKDGYGINGNDIIQKLEISYYDAILGNEKEIKLPDGTTHNITIKPYTKEGDITTIYGKGLNGGNYIIVFALRLPGYVSNDEKELLKKIQELHTK